MSWNRDFLALVKNVSSLSHGEIVVQHDKMEDDINTIYILLKPKDGPFKHGHFEFEISDYSSYPDGCPNVESQTKIYHPNIEDGAVCFSMFDDWSSSYDLTDLAMGLLFLLKNPEISDPLNSEFEGWETEDTFRENVRKSLKGQYGEYPKNWHCLEGEDIDSGDESSDNEHNDTADKDPPSPDPPQPDKTPVTIETTIADPIPTPESIQQPYSKLTINTTFAIGAALIFTIVIYKMVK
ncbi:NEDD8-conjugating enzyme ubc12 [Oopsacas minuta]|uniref:NEDD8-conjugating enzyme ubc12 n=1 Tax=Oopsacas minuta TaxID=111878 RepID=A0AAV7JKM3_9METZ|nr:NEDD8-conjugating enzyme ubc12 [Oopsacas minuta]